MAIACLLKSLQQTRSACLYGDFPVDRSAADVCLPADTPAGPSGNSLSDEESVEEREFKEAVQARRRSPLDASSSYHSKSPSESSDDSQSGHSPPRHHRAGQNEPSPRRGDRAGQNGSSPKPAVFPGSGVTPGQHKNRSACIPAVCNSPALDSHTCIGQLCCRDSGLLTEPLPAAASALVS